jgi:hypothetical protein
LQIDAARLGITTSLVVHVHAVGVVALVVVACAWVALERERHGQRGYRGE